jgi:hypothetical protein
MFQTLALVYTCKIFIVQVLYFEFNVLQIWMKVKKTSYTLFHKKIPVVQFLDSSGGAFLSIQLLFLSMCSRTHTVWDYWTVSSDRRSKFKDSNSRIIRINCSAVYFCIRCSDPWHFLRTCHQMLQDVFFSFSNRSLSSCEISHNKYDPCSCPKSHSSLNYSALKMRLVALDLDIPYNMIRRTSTPAGLGPLG